MNDAGQRRKRAQSEDRRIRRGRPSERADDAGREQIEERRLVHLPAVVGQRQRPLLEDVVNVLLVAIPVEAEEGGQLGQVVAEEHHPRNDD